MQLMGIRHILRALKQAVLDERDRWVYWLPVFLALGIGTYFSLQFEPYFWALFLLLLVLLLVWHLVKRIEVLHYMLICLITVVLGLFVSSIRTHLNYTAMIDRNLGPLMVEGTVIERELRTQGGRVLLSDISSDRAGADLPVKVRLTLRESIPPVGARIRVLANLLPISEPTSPGGYDFRRQAYFDRIGATGIALRPPEVLNSKAQEPGFAENWREQAAERIGRIIGNAEGAIAVALMTGERGTIDETTNENMRKAGTAHLLSISGMHIGMVGGFIFFLARAFMALFPSFALNYPIKKYAAILALSAIIAYTWLVGAPIPAQRSVLMAGLVFVAVLLDRQALSMRSVALAAGVILLLFPESLLNPGFQMSFAAILMLIAAYEWWKLRKTDDEERPGLWGRSWRYVAGIVVTSLIAGFATMPFGAFHFHRLQLLGVLGNLIAVPLTGFVIMPAMVLAYFLMPLGLDWLALKIMGWGLEGVTQSAAWVASLPGADLNAPQFSVWALLLMCLGGLWLAIWQKQTRYLGLLFILAGLLLVPLHGWPIALVSAEGQVAVRGLDGHLYYERTPRGLLVREWGRAYDAGHTPQSWRSAESGVACDALGCVSAQGIAVIRKPEALAEDCSRAKLVIAPDEKVYGCAVQAIDLTTLRRYGAHVLMDDGSIVTARDGSNRPWQPGFSYTASSARRDAPAP